MTEVCGGPYREGEDALLPLDSAVVGICSKDKAVYRETLGQEVRLRPQPLLPPIHNCRCCCSRPSA